MTDNLKEREAFEAWAKSVIASDPQQWPILGGHDGEDYWAYLGFKAGRASVAEAAQSLPDGWKSAVSDLIFHIDDVLPGSVWSLISTEKWNAVTSLLAASTRPQPVQPSARMWHDRIKDDHPTSDPQYWPNALKVEYMEREILDLRALVEQTKTISIPYTRSSQTI